MKTKLSFMVLPVLLLLVGSTGGLFKQLIVGDSVPINEENLLGKWSAFEYYDNNIHPQGQNTDVDYSKINQVAKMINYNSQEYPCPSQLSKVEQRKDFFKVNFLSNGRAEILEKQYKKMNSYDAKCINTIYDESYNETLATQWELNPKDSTLTFSNPKFQNHTQFKISHFANGELHLSFQKDNDYIFVKLQKH